MNGNDRLRERVGQALHDAIQSGAPQPDWNDAREIDRLADAAVAALLAQDGAAAPEGEEYRDEAMAMHWIDRYAAGIDDEPQLDRIAEALAPATHPPADQQGTIDPKLWEVVVRLSGQSVLTIGHNHLSGASNIDDYADAVRRCGNHLLSFIGPSDHQAGEWVLVPREPTERMTVAGFEAASDCEDEQDNDTKGTCRGAAEMARATWAAMIAAAPEPTR